MLSPKASMLGMFAGPKEKIPMDVVISICDELLSKVAYTPTVNINKDVNLNITIGIGFWSHVDKLSHGLPIDVMKMLLTAAALRQKILALNPNKVSKLIIVLADHMAINEGADITELNTVISRYQSELSDYLRFLNLDAHTEIKLSSELSIDPRYQEISNTIMQHESMSVLKNDRAHYRYIHDQTVIVNYLHQHLDVGVKIGWIYKASQVLIGTDQVDKMTQWDELRFDTWYKKIVTSCCLNKTASEMQFLYSKAGLKIRDNQIMEGVPYSAYPQDNRYSRGDIRSEKLTISKAIASNWNGVAEICEKLIEVNVLSADLIPNGIIHRTNSQATVRNFIAHMMKFTFPSLNENTYVFTS